MDNIKIRRDCYILMLNSCGEMVFLENMDVLDDLDYINFSRAVEMAAKL